MVKEDEIPVQSIIICYEHLNLAAALNSTLKALLHSPHVPGPLPCRSDEASAEMEELAKISVNPEEIALGSSGEESDGEEAGRGRVEEVMLEQQVIPSAVFGSIPEEKQGEVLGARERLAAKKKTS